MTNDPNKPIRGFMDGIDWEEHLGHDASGAPVFGTERSLRLKRPCIETGGCGIVEVEVRFIRWVEPQDLKWDHKNHAALPPAAE
jgi:hypothetical protein